MAEPLASPAAFVDRRPLCGTEADAITLELLLSAIPTLPRSIVEQLAERLVDRLDELDGDPDDEESDLEDSFAFSGTALGLIESLWSGPGCELTDPGGGDVGDEGEQEVARTVAVYGVDQTRPDWAPPGYAWEKSHA